MEYSFIDKEIKYIGSQLAPHWIYRNFHIIGDSIVAFTGGADVKLGEMVDIEDVINNEPIYSENMLHFLSEQFNISLTEGVFLQRLLVTIAKETIERLTNKKVERSGDDLFFEDKKLSVSIAAKSFNSVLIHFAMNITSKNTPISTSGLETELHVENIKFLAENILQNYVNELNDINLATCKVRGVS